MKELNLKTIRLYIKEAEKNYKAALRRLKPHGIDQVYINNGCCYGMEAGSRRRTR